MVIVEDPMLCKALFPMLEGPGQLWFMTLPPQSIYKFEEFFKCFLTHFASSMKVNKYFTHLSTIEQNEGEMLRVTQ